MRLDPQHLHLLVGSEVLAVREAAMLALRLTERETEALAVVEREMVREALLLRVSLRLRLPEALSERERERLADGEADGVVLAEPSHWQQLASCVSQLSSFSAPLA
jgi:hypothetical protein